MDGEPHSCHILVHACHVQYATGETSTYMRPNNEDSMRCLLIVCSTAGTTINNWYGSAWSKLSPVHRIS